MAGSEASSYGTGTWLAVAGAVLAVHAGVMTALWDTGSMVSDAGARPEVIQVAVLGGGVAPPAGAQAPSAPTSAPRVSPALATQPTAPIATPPESPPQDSAPTATALDATAPTAPPAEAGTGADTGIDAPTVAQAATASSTPPEPRDTDTPSATWQPPVSGTWTYDVTGQSKGLNYRASATMTWAQDGARYDARLELRALFVGSRVQHSQGRLGPDGLVPERFVDKARKERVLQFDWPQAQLLSQAAPAQLPQGTQDRLSLFLQLGRTLAMLPEAPTAGRLWTLPVATTGEVEPWTFAFAGAERLELPAGPHDTWKLERQRRQAGDQRVELWFAPALHHLPVRIRLVQDNGDEVDQRLSSAERP